MTSLQGKIAAPLSKGKGSSSSSSSATPLLDAETAEKRRWAGRLQAIARRAGDFSKPVFAKGEEGILMEDEKINLNDLVMISGAPSMMAGHVRQFEKFELWADRSQVRLYPITIDKVVCAGSTWMRASAGLRSYLLCDRLWSGSPSVVASHWSTKLARSPS